MSLQRKLEEMAATKKGAEVAAEREAETQRLKPVRDRIRGLEASQQRLKLILETVTDPGFGVREHADKTKGKVRRSSGTLDTTLQQHKDVLRDLGVQTREELAAHPNFTDDVEVVEFKQDQREQTELEQSDTALREALKEFDIDLPTEGFSYDAASAAISEKLQALEKGLWQEKIKTPEGKEAAIEAVTRSIEEALPTMFLDESRGGLRNGYTFNMGLRDSGINIDVDGRVSFESLQSIRLPGNLQILQETYGAEVVEIALRNAVINTAGATVERKYVEKSGGGMTKWEDTQASYQAILSLNNREEFEQFLRRKEHTGLFQEWAAGPYTPGLPRDFEQAQKQVRTILERQEKFKEGITKTLADAYGVKLKISQLEQAMRGEAANGGIYDFIEQGSAERQLKAIEKIKEEASDMLAQLATLEVQLADETVTIDRHTVDVISRRERGEMEKTSISEVMARKKDAYSLAARQVDAHRRNEPRFIGKTKWADELAALEQTERKSKQEWQTEQERLTAAQAVPRSEFYIRLGQDKRTVSALQNMIEEGEYPTGAPGEVFADLKKKLQEIADYLVPESIEQLRRKYDELSSRLPMSRETRA